MIHFPPTRQWPGAGNPDECIFIIDYGCFSKNAKDVKDKTKTNVATSLHPHATKHRVICKEVNIFFFKIIQCQVSMNF